MFRDNIKGEMLSKYIKYEPVDYIKESKINLEKPSNIISIIPTTPHSPIRETILSLETNPLSPDYKALE